jgi:hypothetical protein
LREAQKNAPKFGSGVPEGPVIAIVTEGRCDIRFADARPPLSFWRGESFFIAAGESRRNLSLHGDAVLYAAAASRGDAL